MSIKNTILGNLHWMLVAKFSSQVVSWVSTLLVMRLLRPEDYGLIAMAAVLLNLMTMVNEMGLGQAIIQADDLEDYKVRQCFGLVVLVNGCSYAVLCLLAPVMAWLFSEDKLTLLIPVIGLQFLIQIFLVIPSALLDRKLRFKERAVYEVGAAVAGTVATLLMALEGLGVWAIVFGNLGLVALYTALINWRFPFAHWPVFHFKGIGSMARFGLVTVLVRLLWYAYSQADTFLVGRLLGKTVLGFYSVGVQIATLPLVKISGIFNQLAMAGFSHVKNDQVKMRESVIVVARVASFIAVPIFWGIAAVADDFVTLVLGDTWEPAIFPLQCIALMLPVRVLSIALSQAVNAVGRPELNAINLAVACIVMPAAFIWGIRGWGLEGISLAWVAVYPLWFVYALRQSLPVVNLTIVTYLVSVAPPYLIGGVMALAVMLSRHWIGWGGWLHLLVLVAIGAITYAGLFLLFARKYSIEAISAMRRDAI